MSYIEVQVDRVLCYELPPYLFSFSNHYLYTSECELHKSTSRLCIALSITTTSLVLSPIILSMLQRVSYIEVQVDCVLHYE